MELPKGASHIVKEVAKKLIAKWGREILDKAAKTHFKTAGEI
jgi:ribonuclease HIII